MGKIADYLKREPVRAYLYAVLVAGVAVLAAFGVALTGAQLAAIVGFAGVVLNVGERLRNTVTSPATIEAEAFFAGREDNVTH